MDIEILKYDTREGILLAKKHRLYVPNKNWNLFETYDILLNSNRINDAAIYLAKCNDKYVGVVLLYHNSMNIFVKKLFRRKGIGSLLVFKANDDYKNNIKYGYGINNSYKFFNKLEDEGIRFKNGAE